MKYVMERGHSAVQSLDYILIINHNLTYLHCDFYSAALIQRYFIPTQIALVGRALLICFQYASQ